MIRVNVTSTEGGTLQLQVESFHIHRGYLVYRDTDGELHHIELAMTRLVEFESVQA